jgi:integrase
MARPPTGQVLERDGKRGRTYALRFRAYGRREYVTLGAAPEWTRQRAEEELENVLADVRRGIWRPPVVEQPEAPKEEATLHMFASEWLTARKLEGLSLRTIEDYEWALTHHLLPHFSSFRLSEITAREVDRYKTAKAAEGILSPNSINKTLTRLAQVLEVAVEYGDLESNPANGKRRRLKGTTPRRPWVEPEQLPSLLEAAAGYLTGRGRPLVAVLAGAGLRISEALALERRDINLARGTLAVRKSKTEAGERIVDLTPALRDELAGYIAGRPDAEPTALLFPTHTGRLDTRSNVRKRLLVPAIKKANKTFAKLGIEPMGKVSPHGLRRTYASLRCAVGDNPAYTCEQLGHTDARFTLRVYTAAVKQRQRLSEAERQQFDRAIEWAQWAQVGTNPAEAVESLSGATPSQSTIPLAERGAENGR